jgi:hypothetical protein
MLRLVGGLALEVLGSCEFQRFCVARLPVGVILDEYMHSFYMSQSGEKLESRRSEDETMIDAEKGGDESRLGRPITVLVRSRHATRLTFADIPAFLAVLVLCDILTKPTIATQAGLVPSTLWSISRVERVPRKSNGWCMSCHSRSAPILSTGALLA